MQQLYRCFSWRLAHPQLPSILVTGHKTVVHSPTSHISVRDINGNDRTVTSSDQLVLCSVQGKYTGMYEGDTAITDFAIIDPNRTLYQFALRYLQHEQRL
jgi:hypothetical protein